LLRPGGVIIGGGVAGASEFFLPAAREGLQRRLEGRGLECPSILQSALGAYSGAAGAALGARDAS
ncbi:MAG: ROK family protein, partial [Planctomycetota bacterium]|nr:ROK family protein [Planctomycetota bacterium]